MSASSLCKGNLSHFHSVFHANISSKLLSKNLRTIPARSPNTLSSSTITFSRAYAVRPPPPSAETPSTTVFTGPSQPRPYHANHPMPRRRRELPTIPRRWPLLLAFSIAGLAGWGIFLTYVTNQEKISSSVLKSIMRAVRNDEKLREVLGEAIRPQPEWWLNGDPRIKGTISTMQGNVDVSFRIKGSKGAGTLYFTSIRREKGLPFTILRFKVIADDGQVVEIETQGL
ncbi:cytochrome oxidase assembly protein 1 [Stygiomarasmius scandens]|uniref:Cytochrome oxidase assembly protein 1 n=1 Tax=Marasmiellus scandens TaxID=2682957 RepID=A0ABR1J0K0_9AGAR